MKKVDNFLRAVGNLEEAVQTYRTEPNNALYRDGLIHRFEIAAELGWKSAKEYLEDQGYTLLFSSPKSVLKDAYAAGMLDDEQAWLEIISARNMTSHIYDEAAAVDIAARICGPILPAFQALAAFYRA